MTPRERHKQALQEVLDCFYRYEGPGLADGSHNYRCIVCGHGWTRGGTFEVSINGMHHVGCAVEKARAVLVAAIDRTEERPPFTLNEAQAIDAKTREVLQAMRDAAGVSGIVEYPRPSSYRPVRAVVEELFAARKAAPAPPPSERPTTRQNDCAKCGHARTLHYGPEDVCVADCRSLRPLVQCGCPEFVPAPQPEDAR